MGKKQINTTTAPKNYSIVTGCGYGKYELTAFDNALLDAGIGDYNIVKVSSILPQGCKPNYDLKLEKGSIIYAAFSSIVVSGNNVGRAAVGVAIPELDSQSGVIFECSIHSKEDIEKKIEDMCREAMNNRNRGYKEIITKSVTAKTNEKQIYDFCCAVAAVVMW